MAPVRDPSTQSQIPQPQDNTAAQPRQPKEAHRDRPRETQDAGDRAPQPRQPKEAHRDRPRETQEAGDRLRTSRTQIQLPRIAIQEGGDRARAPAVAPDPVPRRNPRLVDLAFAITLLCGLKIVQFIGRENVIRLVRIFCSLAISYIFAFTMIQFGVLDPCFAKARTGRICKSQVYIYKLLSYTHVQDEYTCVFFEGHRLKTVAEATGWDFGGISC